MESPASYVHSTLRVPGSFASDVPRSAGVPRNCVQRSAGAAGGPCADRAATRHDERGEGDGSSCAHLLPAAPVLEIANNSLRLTMKSAPLAGTGVE